METSRLQSPEFGVSSRVDGDAAVVELVGELDEWTRPRVDEEIHVLGRAGVTQFTVDATGLTFVGVSGVHALVALLADHPASLVAVVGASASFAKLLEVSGVGAHLADVQLRA